MNPSTSEIGRLDGAGRVQRIPRFVEGGSKPSIFSATDMNVLVDAINRLLNMRITRGSCDMVIFADDGVVIQLANPKGELSAITAG